PDVWSYTLSQHNFSNSSTLKIDHGIRGNLLCLSTAMLQPAVREHAHSTGSPAAPCKRLVIQPAPPRPAVHALAVAGDLGPSGSLPRDERCARDRLGARACGAGCALW